MMATAPALFFLSLVQVSTHLSFILLVGGKVFKMRKCDLLIASNANVGGPTTAAAMAAAKGWRSLVVPAMLTGVLGYAFYVYHTGPHTTASAWCTSILKDFFFDFCTHPAHLSAHYSTPRSVSIPTRAPRRLSTPSV
jgi:hypothetical protein